MKLGLIGRGNWGNVYARTLQSMGIEFRQMGQDWDCKGLDGVIIASKAESHFMIAKAMLLARMPVLIEKPVCRSAKQADKLLGWAEDYKNSIALCGYTRLYSPAWKEFKYGLPEVVSVKAQAGSKCKIHPKLDWGTHLVAMCLDIGFSPFNAEFTFADYSLPFRFVVNDTYVFDDPKTMPMPLEVLISEFVKSIEKGEQRIDDLKLSVSVMEYIDGAH